MRTKEISVYSFNELNDEAKERVRCDLMGEYLWASEARATLDAFCDIFSITWQSYDIDYGSIDFRLDLNDDVLALKGARAISWIRNNTSHKIFKGKYYSKNKTVNGKFSYISRHSKILKSWDNCPLTGVCFDYAILEPLADFITFKKFHPFTTLESVLSDCLHAFIAEVQEDYENQQEEEYIAEHCEANNYEFDEYGNIA